MWTAEKFRIAPKLNTSSIGFSLIESWVFHPTHPCPVRIRTRWNIWNAKGFWWGYSLKRLKYLTSPLRFETNKDIPSRLIEFTLKFVSPYSPSVNIHKPPDRVNWLWSLKPS
jgi:hypothetical protein